MLKFFSYYIFYIHTFFGMYCKPVIRSGNQPGHCQIGSTRMSHLSFFSILLQTGYCYTAQYTMAKFSFNSLTLKFSVKSHRWNSIRDPYSYSVLKRRQMKVTNGVTLHLTKNSQSVVVCRQN